MQAICYSNSPCAATVSGYDLCTNIQMDFDYLFWLPCVVALPLCGLLIQHVESRCWIKLAASKPRLGRRSKVKWYQRPEVVNSLQVKNSQMLRSNEIQERPWHWSFFFSVTNTLSGVMAWNLNWTICVTINTELVKRYFNFFFRTNQHYAMLSSFKTVNCERNLNGDGRQTSIDQYK